MGADWSLQDFEFMQAALSDAGKAADDGEIPVGAVVVLNGEIIAAGHNTTIAAADPSGHAEIVALRLAARQVGNHRLTGATLYVTLEPCVMCVGAIAQARVGRVVFGAYDTKAGALGSVEDLSDSRALNHRFEINGGLLADECGSLLSEFFVSRRKKTRK
jgi:tRNA(adenine34) deaminase